MRAGVSFKQANSNLIK